MGPRYVLSIQRQGPNSSRLPQSVEVTDKTTTAELAKSIADSARLPENQIRISKLDKRVVVKSRDVLAAEAVGIDEPIVVKNLGRQIGWRTVFVLEYLGCILIHPIVFAYFFTIRNPSIEPSGRQVMTLAMILIHFFKREFESVFVHHFSAETMPFFNLFKNSAHYWIGSGLAIALETYSQKSLVSSSKVDHLDDLSVSTSPVAIVGLAMFTVGQVVNLVAHLKLRALRRAGTKDRGIPVGFPLFDIVTCPNYTFEIIAWIGICLVSSSVSAVLFTVIAASQMAVWATGKEKRYRREFPEKYHNKRWVIFPPFY